MDSGDDAILHHTGRPRDDIKQFIKIDDSFTCIDFTFHVRPHSFLVPVLAGGRSWISVPMSVSPQLRTTSSTDKILLDEESHYVR